MKKNRVLLKDSIVKKILNSDKEVCREYLTRVISCASGIDIDLLRGNIELVQPDIGSNVNSVNSEADGVYKSKDNYFNIEVNYINSRKTTVVVKNNTYLYNLILRQLGSHKDYEKVKAVIQININNYDYFKKNEFVYVSRMIEEKHHLVRDDMIKIVDINLPYLEKIDYNNIKKGKEFDLEKLLYIFVCDDKNILDQVYDGDEIMKKVIEDEEVFMDVMDSLLYYKYEDLLTEEEKEEFYKKQEEAKEQGRIETQKEIVKNMQEAGISDDVILKSLNIDQEMLNKLKKK